MTKKYKTIYYLVFITVVLYTNLQTFAMENDSQEDNISQNSQQKTISNTTYIVGGIASLAGFGIGHAIQGRYLENGWIFTLLDVGTIVGFVSSYIIAFSSPDIPPYLYVLVGATYLGFGSRICQIINAWWLPDHYKVVRNIELSPDLYTTHNGDLALGLSLKYKF